MMVDSRFYSEPVLLSVSELAEVTGSSVHGDNTRIISGVAPLDEAKGTDLTFFDNPAYKQSFINSRAGVICVHFDKQVIAPKDSSLLLSNNPYKIYAIALSRLFPEKNISPVISENSDIDSSAKVGLDCSIHSGVIIESNVVIGDNCFIGSNTVIKSGVIIGGSCYIDSNVTISHSILGFGTKIGSGSRIGQEGFGFVPEPDNYIPVPQLGRVQVGDKVSIGSNCTIDRGSSGDTIIGSGTHIDNLVHIAHNVRLGRGCILAGQSGIAGSTILGNYVQMGGQAGISGHLIIGDRVKIAAGSGVIKSLPEGIVVGGYPALPIRNWHKQTLQSKYNKD